jgi:hypothetical protein
MSKSGISELLNQIRVLIVNARTTVAKSTDFVQVWTNFQTGRLIVEDEQDGAKRAAYAEKTIVELSKRLSAEFGRGFAKRNLEYMRQFYQMYSSRIAQSPIAQFKSVDNSQKLKSLISKSNAIGRTPIVQSLIAQFQKGKDTYPPGIFKLSWTHYLFLMGIDDPEERSFYEIEAAAQNWAVRELKRQFNTSL